MGFLQAGQRSVRSIAAPIQRSSRAWRALAVRGTAPRCSRAERVHAVCSVVGLDTYVKHGVKLAIAFLAALATLLACSDDEAPARTKLGRWLSEQGDMEVVAQSADGVSAAQAIGLLRPDVVFLDIQMPGLSGLEVAAQLEQSRAPLLVFVTAYDEHAVKAFELEAVD